MSPSVHLTLNEAIASLRRDPDHPVEADVGGMIVEIRARPKASAADVFDRLGPWEGESAQELLDLLEKARRSGGSGQPPAL